MAASRIRSWRAAFLTLRDESSSSSSLDTTLKILRDLVLQSEIIVPASRDLDPSELASDMMLLVELASCISVGDSTMDSLIQICRMIYEVSCQASLVLDTNMCHFLMGYLEKVMVENKIINDFGFKTFWRMVLEILGHIVSRSGEKWSFAETSHLIRLLLKAVNIFHIHSNLEVHQQGSYGDAANDGSLISCTANLWEVQTSAYSILGDALSKMGPSISEDLWQSVIQVLRMEMDHIATRKLLVEGLIMSRFYASLLLCLHLILSVSKGSFSEHMATFVTSLGMFFKYGIRPSYSSGNAACTPDKPSTMNHNSISSSLTKVNCSRYRPPHLRKREKLNLQPPNFNGISVSILTPVSECTTSDSEQSDSDGQSKDVDPFRSSKARVCAIICIQDLCQVDPKLLSTFWSILLPTYDVLCPRNYKPTLMTCLLFDPALKVRMVAAATIGTFLDVCATSFLQVAEFKEANKCSSFKTLSSSLGEILIQLHSGLLYLVEHESHSRLLASIFKVLRGLISVTPYARLPGKLLPDLISCVYRRICGLLCAKKDETSLVVSALNCLHVVFSLSPPSVDIMELLQKETSKGQSTLLASMFQLCLQQPICLDVLQVLKAVIHNYPDVVATCWDSVSWTVSKILQSDVSTTNNMDSSTEKCVASAIKVLDECLRAISGFKGMDDLLDDRLSDVLFASEHARRSNVSSAPSFTKTSSMVSSTESSCFKFSGTIEWEEAIERHISPALAHVVPLVRAASVMCFAGLTSSTFASLTKITQDIILSSVVKAARYDKAPSVRTSACRAIGVIACFSQITIRDIKELLHAAESNTHDRLITVRITAAWAVANICDHFRCKAIHSHEDEKSQGFDYSNAVGLLFDCSLRLTEDGDKVKANAVRALGNLSRFVSFVDVCEHAREALSGDRIRLSCSSGGKNPGRLTDGYLRTSDRSSLLGRMVQAFMSCASTGNVKVQWNVCHALANLFLNETVFLQNMSWAPSVFSVLLLLLRDSPNFKIRIHAAAALAVVGTRHEYGRSFIDVLQGVEHVLETLDADKVILPSSFKYRVALEEQLASTMLHVLGLASQDDLKPVKEFLVKKAVFLEEWLSKISLKEFKGATEPREDTSADTERNEQCVVQRKESSLKALRSLIQIDESCNDHLRAQRLEKLISQLC